MRFYTFISRILANTPSSIWRRPGGTVVKTGIGTATFLLAGLLMMLPVSAGSLPSPDNTGLNDAARHWLTEKGLLHPAGMAECKSSSDCAKGEICCKVSALESFCADPDECFVARPVPQSPRH